MERGMMLDSANKSSEGRSNLKPIHALFEHALHLQWSDTVGLSEYLFTRDNHQRERGKEVTENKKSQPRIKWMDPERRDPKY